MVGEVFVTWGIEQVQDGPVVLEGHHRGCHRDATRSFGRHPVGARAAPVLLRLDLPGKLNGAAEQQKLFGERRLARVRVRNDREGAPALDLAFQVTHSPARGVLRLALLRAPLCRPG